VYQLRPFLTSSQTTLTEYPPQGNASVFRTQVDYALNVVKRVLEVSRHPQIPGDVHHKYDDKYLLAEIVTNTSVAAIVNCLELLGALDLTMLKEWSQTKALTLAFRSTERYKNKKNFLISQMHLYQGTQVQRGDLRC
jgi:hypothetical protein